MIDALARAFRARFGRDPEVGARAPGRVNLIGEHTDYEDGLVLPCAIDRDTLALAARRDDTRFRVFSREQGEPCEFDAEDLARRGGWVDYPQAVVFALRERGVSVRGLDLGLASDVPPGSGLSSSAALQLAVAAAIDAAQGLALDPVARAHVVHRAENGFVGVPCGVMDPFACALGRRDHALRIDCRSLAVREVPLPGDRLRIVIAHSGVRRALAERGYRARREECRAAFLAARAAGIAAPHATALRDLAPDRLPALERALDEVPFRRARHVISENARVDRVCDALAAGDLAAAGNVLRDGMRSLRDDFEVSIPELDALCALADAVPGVYGSRLTGAGFGGCTVHLVEPAAEACAIRALADGFERRFGRRPSVQSAVASDGASILPM